MSPKLNGRLIPTIALAMAVAAALASAGAGSRVRANPAAPHGNAGNGPENISSIQTELTPAPCHPNRFEPDVVTGRLPGFDNAAMTAMTPVAGMTGGDCGSSTTGSVCLALEPKPGVPADYNDADAFIDVCTDIDPMFVISNQSGWYEGWMIHDLKVAPVGPPRGDGHARFGMLLQQDADQIRAMGTGNNIPGRFFTIDGGSPRFPDETDRVPGFQGNTVPIYLSMGAYNALQQGDVQSYWEFNDTTNWVSPFYELPVTGGIPGTFEAGRTGAFSRPVPGSGSSGVEKDPTRQGDKLSLSRDPVRFGSGTQREFRGHVIPSGLAHEIYLDVYERPASFEPGVGFPQRLLDAYAAEVARVDQNGDGAISAVEGDVDRATDGFADNSRLFLPVMSFNRLAVTREGNPGFLAPRFAPSQRAWILTGPAAIVSPAVPASQGLNSDDR